VSRVELLTLKNNKKMNIKLEKYNDKVIRRIIIGLIIFLPIIFNPFGFCVFPLPRIALLYLTTTFLVIIFLYSCIKNQTFIYKKSLFYLLIGVFLFFIILSALFSQDKYTAFFGYSLTYEGVFSWLCYFVLFFLANLYFNSEKEIKKLFLILSIPLFFVSLFAIGEYFFHWQIMEWHQNKGERVISFLGSPSFLGVYLVLLLPIYINFIRLKEFNWKWRGYLIVLNLMAILSLLMTFSRGAWLGFSIAMIFLILINLKNRNLLNLPYQGDLKKKKFSESPLDGHRRGWGIFKKETPLIPLIRGTKLISPLIIFTALIISGWLLINNTYFGQQIIDRIKFSFVQNPATTVNTSSGRLLLWQQTINMIKDHIWFGVGPDNFAPSIPKYFLPEWHLYFGLQAEKAHNEFLNLWATMGIGALLSYLIILIYFFYILLSRPKRLIEAEWRDPLIPFKGISVGKNLQNNSQTILIQGILASMIAYLVAMQFHYSSIDLAPLFWIFMGIALSLIQQDGNIKSRDAKFCVFAFVKYVFGAIAIFLILLIVLFSYKIIRADYFFVQGLKNNQIDLAIENLEKAIEKNKRSIDYYVTLSDFYFQKGARIREFNNFDKSIEILERVIKLYPNNYRSYFILGETYLKMVSFAQNKNLVFQKAEQAFKNSLKFFPNSVDTHLNLGIVFIQQQKFEQALTEFKKCVLINPKKVECLFNQGKIYEQQKDFKQAKEFYQKVLKIDPNLKVVQEALEKFK